MKITNILPVIIVLLITFSCNNKKEHEEISDLDKIKQNNKNTYPSTKMDSTQAINSITQQKIQELLDLATIYASGNKNTEVDTLIYEQMNGYFLSPDSIKIATLIKELDSLKVKSIKIKSLNIQQEIKNNDTLDIASFQVEYWDKNRQSLGYFDKKASYVLKKSPVQFVKEFKFYFLDFDLKEIISEEVAK